MLPVTEEAVEAAEMDAFDAFDGASGDEWDSGPEEQEFDEPAGAEITDESGPSGDLLLDVGGQLSLKVGGEKPSVSTVGLKGRKIELEGELAKGQEVRLLVVAECTEVHFVGGKQGTTRKHVLEIRGVERA